MMDPTIFFKAISEQTRLQSLLLIAEQYELCVCELMTALQLSQPKISRHLAQLKHAEIVIDRRQGQWVFYQINPELAPWQLTILNETLTHHNDYIMPALSRLNAMGSRPARILACCNE